MQEKIEKIDLINIEGLTEAENSLNLFEQDTDLNFKKKMSEFMEIREHKLSFEEVVLNDVERKVGNTKFELEPAFYYSNGRSIFSYADYDMVRDEQGVYLEEQVLIEEVSGALKVGDTRIIMPPECQLYVYPLFLMIDYLSVADNQKKRVIIYNEKEGLRFFVKNKGILFSDSEWIMMDNRGLIAIEDRGQWVNFNLEEKFCVVEDLKVDYHESSSLLAYKDGKFYLGDLVLDLVNYSAEYKNNEIVFLKGQNLLVKDNQLIFLTNSKIETFLLEEGDLILKRADLKLVFPKAVKMNFDNNQCLGFVFNKFFCLIDLGRSILRLGKLIVKLDYKLVVRFERQNIYFNEVSFYSTQQAILTLNKCKWHLDSVVSIKFRGEEVSFRLDNGQRLHVRPFKKEIFININGVFIAITVSIGVALDRNGNIAFDYQGHLVTLDVIAKIINISGVSLKLENLSMPCVHFMGKQILLAEKPKDIMGLLADQLFNIRDNSNIMEDMSIVMELLINSDDPDKIIELLKEMGIAIDSSVLEKLLNIFPEVLKDFLALEDIVKLSMINIQENLFLQFGENKVSLPCPSSLLLSAGKMRLKIEDMVAEFI